MGEALDESGAHPHPVRAEAACGVHVPATGVVRIFFLIDIGGSNV
jgi:hypothetical protein